MIPKIIHYSWFSGEEMPVAYRQMVATWKTVLPDYEFRLWDAEALKKANLRFANEAYSVRKWAFAADAIRNYALYTYGGIWLDCDVIMYRSFDSLLKYRMFIGKEWAEEFDEKGCGGFNRLTSHCMGAEKGHPFFKESLKYYEDRPFIVSRYEALPHCLKYDMRLMSSTHAIIAMRYGYKGSIGCAEKEEVIAEDIHILPAYCFDNPHYHGIEDVYCVHNHLHSWEEANKEKTDFDMVEKPRKKNWEYYLFTFVNKILRKRGLCIRLRSL